MKATTYSLLLALASPGFSSALHAEVFHNDNDRVQVFLGFTDLNDQTGELQNDDGDPVDIDFSNLPTIGLEVETPYGNRDSGLEYGINAGGGISWKGDDTEFAGTVGGSGSRVVFRIDNSFTLLELHLGGYLRAHLGKTVDVYLGGGPAIIFGSHDVQDDDIEEEAPVSTDGTIILNSKDSSDIVLGYYARAGIEFDTGDNSQWGLGIRYLGGEMEFDDTVGEFDIDAVQILLTYSAWF
jgi:opacity protein-like surface antigen